MFDQLLTTIKELHDECAAPNSWEEIVYEKVLEAGYSEEDANDLSNAAVVIANVFASEMLARLDDTVQVEKIKEFKL